MLSKYARRAASMLGAAGLSLALFGCSCYPEPLQPVGPVIVAPPQPVGLVVKAPPQPVGPVIKAPPHPVGPPLSVTPVL